jgi:hypothetical protein
MEMAGDVATHACVVREMKRAIVSRRSRFLPRSAPYALASLARAIKRFGRRGVGVSAVFRRRPERDMNSVRTRFVCRQGLA